MTNGYLHHFEACNRHDLSKFMPFYISSAQYGWAPQELARQLLGENRDFVEYEDGFALAEHLNTLDLRSAAFARAVEQIAARTGQKLRNEMYPVVLEWGDEPVAQIDRLGVPWFGVHGFGVHVNGFVRKPDGIHLWIGERAADRQVDPGKLDNMIGGGQPIGLSLEENLLKEAKEEAGLNPALARRAKPVSTLRYLLERQGGLRNDTLFVYDLELPPDVTPRNTDGEVARFHLMPLPEAAALVHDTDRFKFNCNLVVVDFLVRHGFLGPKDEEFREIQSSLGKMTAGVQKG